MDLKDKPAVEDMSVNGTTECCYCGKQVSKFLILAHEARCRRKRGKDNGRKQ